MTGLHQTFGYAWAVVAVIVASWCGLLLAYARPLTARWREPAFRCPILVLESDDWGAGPVAQAEALGAILAVLRNFKDVRGRSPVFTLGVVLEVPDTARMAAEGLAPYRACKLDDDCYAGLRGVIHAGIRERIFVPQLHGQCHYWPDALLRAAERDPEVRAWLTRPGLPRTEDLPSHLQSRWVDAAQLPSSPLATAQIDVAVAGEAEEFQRHFGEAPKVAVPTTFVWTDAVEQAWSAAGVEVIITPGRRATARNADGEPAGVDRAMLTGELSKAGPCYLVRDVYFEPALGHFPERLVDGLAARTRQGRACLVEMHRLNFLDKPERSLDALRDAIGASLASFPTLRFVTPSELAMAIVGRDPALIEFSFSGRLRAWLERVGEIPRFSKLSRMTGMALPLWLVERVLGA